MHVVAAELAERVKQKRAVIMLGVRIQVMLESSPAQDTDALEGAASC
jgi:hypothetical protein